MTTHMNRRTALAAVAAVPAAAALATPALAEVDVDAELREFWSKYLVQLGAVPEACDTHWRLRKASGYDAEFDALRPTYRFYQGYAELHELLWKKHGLEPSSGAAHREDTKLRRIVAAIRKVKAKSMFGIGVKLSAWEDEDHIDDVELAAVIDSVRRDLRSLTGVDFIAATGKVEV